MYSLKNWITSQKTLPMDDWDGKFYCTETNAEISFRVNTKRGFLKAYTFTLVIEGSISLLYNGRELTLQADDLYIYSPGQPLTIIAASDDYHGICLLVDELTTIDIPTVRDLMQIAYMPIMQLHEPKLSLPHDEAQNLATRMHEIINYLYSDHTYKAEMLRMLVAIFMLDLQNEQEHAVVHRRFSQRVEDIFMDFIQLLPKHFAEHHDISFYASALHISPVSLSRIVRQVSNRTVVDYINQMLLMEATFLLHTSKLSIAQIADRLHFADAPSFSKFFSRLKGQSPRAFREQ